MILKLIGQIKKFMQSHIKTSMEGGEEKVLRIDLVFYKIDFYNG